MRRLVLLAFLLPLSLCAQVNDMFYVPKKEVKLKDVEKVLSAEEDDEWGVVDNGNNRDVDEYNRRVKVVPRDCTYVTEEVYVEDVYDAALYVDDYNYTTRIVRFHNPTMVVVGSPWYWSISPYYHYDPFWDSYWDYSWHYGNYNYYSGLYGHWHAAPVHSYTPHHYGGVKRATDARRIPVANASKGATVGRVPVASSRADNTAGRRPVANGQVNGNNRNERKSNNVGVAERQVREKRERPAVSNSHTENRKGASQRSSNSSTYNRRSSTSVNRSGSSHSGNRTPVSRGGVSRGGRR